MSKFVEKLVTKKIYTLKNERAFDWALVSVVPEKDMSSTDLVIGAKWENSEGSHFTKETLGHLIEELTEIHSAMK